MYVLYLTWATFQYFRIFNYGIFIGLFNYLIWNLWFHIGHRKPNGVDHFLFLD
jgi:hypothetical protein